MKLLLVFRSFLPRRLSVEISSENWFAAGSRFGSENYFAASSQFGSENCFATGATVSTANHNFAAANSTSAANRKFAAEHATRQRIVNALQPTQFRQRITIRCKTHNSATNANSLQPTQFWQRITISLHNTQLGSEC
jgi:hypothetical protein